MRSGSPDKPKAHPGMGTLPECGQPCAYPPFPRMRFAYPGYHAFSFRYPEQTMCKLVDVDGLIAAQRDFATARHWQPYHTPRNLMLALAGEVGELAEIFQWKTDAEAAQLAANPAEFTHLQEELADVLMYLVRLADVCQVDLNAAAIDKLRKNALKYPAPASQPADPAG